MDVNFLLDKCKEVCGVRTDGELAAALGVSKQALSSYRNGHRLPDPVQCATIAGLSGLPLAQVMGIVGEARAISREEKAVWRKLAATAALLAVVVFPALSERAHAAERASESVTVGIMRNYGWAQGQPFLEFLTTGLGKAVTFRPAPGQVTELACSSGKSQL